MPTVTTVIMSTHDVEIAYSWADEMRVLHQGKLEFSGSPEDFFGDEAKLREIGLVPPMLFEMNQYLVRTKGADERPFPRTSAEMALKIFHGSRGALGRGTIVSIGPDSKSQEGLAIFQDDEHGRASIGVHGTRSRKLANCWGNKVDYRFSAYENSILRACEGRDFVLYVDDVLVPMVEARLRRLEESFDIRIERKRIDLV